MSLRLIYPNPEAEDLIKEFDKMERAASIKRVEDLEIRWSETIGKNPTKYLELVKWETPEGGTPYCYTLCLWDKTKEGWELRYIGSRPFDYEHHQLLFHLTVYGQRILDAEYKLERFLEDK